ncbi:putative BRISC complex subunit Abro1 [Apostichopus japonicus]|uniref:Putative BRISC complex subunit Abro1 n=1 Tax=Stichopus japonicus TaxID=307972 RepID=A0A2G8JT68_STIJA|nr:putative BRISC complex subunit Abro1 [Apostichopus japonicus]
MSVFSLLQEGFLIGEVSMQEVTNISDSQINTTTRETTVNVISHTICPKPFSFYNRLGQVDREKLAALLKSNCDNVVGWFRCRSGSMPEPSLRENAIHHHLRDLLGTHYQNFLFGIFGEGSNMNHTTITYYYNFYTYNNGLFSPQKVAIENLGDTAQSEYKHGSSLNTESSGSDSYRDILTSHKKDMIDKVARN